MKSIPITNIYLDTRRIKKDNTFPVKLRLCFQRQVKFYNTDLSLNQKDFDTLMTSKKLTLKEKAIKADFAKIEAKATFIIENLQIFSFSAFNKKFLGPDYQKGDVYAKYDECIAELEQNEQFGTASSYRCSKISIEKFLEKHYHLKTEVLLFSAITPSFLQEYENYMVKEMRRTPSTVGIYLRPLRALFNTLKEDGEISTEMYPFGKRKYQIPLSTSHKRGLEDEAMKKLFNAPADQYEEKARDFWLLSYLCNGINNADLISIKYGINLKKDEIVFFRNKTKRTNKGNSKPIIVPLVDEARRIINKYRNADDKKGKFVFPTLNESMNSKEQWIAGNNFNRFVGQHIKTLAEKAGIDRISPMWARHTFAVTMRNNGSNDELISDSLGHASVNTTKNYLNGFRMEKKKEFANKLMDFLNEKTPKKGSKKPSESK